MLRWIFSLAAALTLAFFLDRVGQGSSAGLLPSPPSLAERTEAPPRIAVPRPEPGPEMPFHSPIETKSILRVEHAGEEPGSDDSGRALHLFAPRATPVLAPFDGEVLQVTHLTSTGLAIDVVDDPGRRLVRLGHLLRISPEARAGEKVSVGQVIGWVGDTGAAGPGRFVLHVSLRRIADDGRWWEAPAVDATPVLGEPGRPSVRLP